MPSGLSIDSTTVADYSQPPQAAPAGVTAEDIAIVTPVVPVPTVVSGRPT